VEGGGKKIRFRKQIDVYTRRECGRRERERESVEWKDCVADDK
jgi:hypothetical protein